MSDRFFLLAFLTLYFESRGFGQSILPVLDSIRSSLMLFLTGACSAHRPKESFHCPFFGVFFDSYSYIFGPPALPKGPPRSIQLFFRWVDFSDFFPTMLFFFVFGSRCGWADSMVLFPPQTYCRFFSPPLTPRYFPLRFFI